jgi:hypothetical protein
MIGGSLIELSGRSWTNSFWTEGNWSKRSWSFMMAMQLQTLRQVQMFEINHKCSCSLDKLSVFFDCHEIRIFVFKASNLNNLARSVMIIFQSSAWFNHVDRNIVILWCCSFWFCPFYFRFHFKCLSAWIFAGLKVWMIEWPNDSMIE